MPARLPFALAVAMTLLNAAKPAVVDDTAYLFFARHLADHPLDPYGWELFWSLRPEPAMNILLPPVLPYWLAAGVRLFGEHLFLLKLWLFPFAWLLCASAASLLKRFAPGDRAAFLPVLLTPVLPLFNVMLDIPALALGAAAMAVFISGIDRRQLWRCAVAGLLAGLAMQTKYSMLTIPVAMAAYAGTRNTVGLAVAAAGGVAVFAGWEAFVFTTHGESHFLHHLREAGSVSEPKWALVRPLLAHFGALGCGLAVVAGGAAGWPRRLRVASAAVVAAFLAALCVLPHRWTAIPGQFDLASSGFMVIGVATLATLALLAVRVVRRTGCDRDTLFLLGWVGVEVAGMFATSPFPAARRWVGPCLALTVFTAHASVRLAVPPARWAVGFAVGVGLFIAAVDLWDAFPEKVLADRAAELVTPTGAEVVWYAGHWGFQFYAERHGMRPITPATPFRAGDWLVIPQGGEFDRPSVKDRDLPRPGMKVDRIAMLTWDDGLKVRTIPGLSGGPVPLRGRDGPRLTVAVYRVLADWPARQ